MKIFNEKQWESIRRRNYIQKMNANTNVVFEFIIWGWKGIWIVSNWNKRVRIWFSLDNIYYFTKVSFLKWKIRYLSFLRYSKNQAFHSNFIEHKSRRGVFTFIGENQNQWICNSKWKINDSVFNLLLKIFLVIKALLQQQQQKGGKGYCFLIKAIKDRFY